MPSGDEVTVPQPQMPDVVREWNDKKGKVARMKIATSREFFEALEKEAETWDFAKLLLEQDVAKTSASRLRELVIVLRALGNNILPFEWLLSL